MKIRLLSALKASESLKESEKNFDDTKPKINFSKSRIEEIREKFKESKYKFSKSKINEIRRNLYEIENKKNLSLPKIKEIEKNLLESEKYLFKPKKCYDYDDDEYKGIRIVKNLFNPPTDKDYYKPIITNSAFNSNFIQYKSYGNKDKILTISEYLDMIKPYLCYMINTHKAQEKIWRIHLRNKIIERKTQGEWKIQLTMVIILLFQILMRLVSYVEKVII